MAVEDRRGPLAGGRSGCPDAERLAEYVEGVLGEAERQEIERHLVTCPDCRAAVAETMAFVHTEEADSRTRGAQVMPFRSRRWLTGAAAALAAAAAIVLVVRVVRPEWLLGPRTGRPELQELVAAVANEPTRPVEGRLTGGFKYGPPPSPTRGPGDHEASPDVRIAAAKIEKLAREKDTPENQAALGIAYLATGDLDQAVAALEDAVAREPASAHFHSDLSAGYLARAQRGSRADDLPKALTAAERALELKRDLVEAFFNKALALHYLKQPARAAAAWREYVERDQGSGWAQEAAQR